MCIGRYVYSRLFVADIYSVKACSAIRLVQQFDDVRDAAIGVEHSRAGAQLHVASGVGSGQNLSLRGLRFADLIGEQALGHLGFAQVIDARAATAILHSFELSIFEAWNRGQDLLRRGRHALRVVEMAWRVVSDAAVDFGSPSNVARGQELGHVAYACAEAFSAVGV